MSRRNDEVNPYVPLAVAAWSAVALAAAIVVFLLIGTSGEDVAPGERMQPPMNGSPTRSPGDQVDAEIRMVPTIMFNTEELSVQEGEVTIRATNEDDAIQHNFAVYQSRQGAEGGGEAIAATEVCSAPCTQEVSFDTPQPGQYFFRCDVHPQQMTGTLVVQ